MMKLTALFMFLFLVSIASAEDKQTDAELILGSWKLVETTFGETLSKIPHDKGVVMTFKKDNRVSEKFPPSILEGETHNWDYTIDQNKNPKHIDMQLKSVQSTSGQETKSPPHKPIKSIYSLEGDILKICSPRIQIEGEESSRPTKIKVGKGWNVRVYRRVTKTDDSELILGSWKLVKVTVNEKISKNAPGRVVVKKFKKDGWASVSTTFTELNHTDVKNCVYEIDPTKAPKHIGMQLRGCFLILI